MFNRSLTPKSSQVNLKAEALGVKLAYFGRSQEPWLVGGALRAPRRQSLRAVALSRGDPPHEGRFAPTDG
jgi:hypothetical protein